MIGAAGLDMMAGFQEAVSEAARKAGEEQLEAIDTTIAEVVRREIHAALLGSAVGEPLSGVGSCSSLGIGTFYGPEPPPSAGGVTDLEQKSGPPAPFAPVIHAETLRLPSGRVTANYAPDTIWEASLLGGLPVMGPLGSIVLALGFASALGTQAVIVHKFAFEVARSGSFVGRFNLWTLLIGLWPEWNDRRSLDARLFQFLTTGVVSPPAAGMGAESFFRLLAITICMLSVGREMKHTLTFAASICTLPIKTSTVARCGDMYVLTSISLQRLMLAISLAASRLIVASSLLIVGVLRLSKARSYMDLALSSAVLGLALDIPRRAWAWGAAAHRFGRVVCDWFHGVSRQQVAYRVYGP